jgi:hypothetical protein
MARPRIRPAARRTQDPEAELDEQQKLVIAALRRARGQPIPYSQLKDAGVELPASVVSELELVGWPVERCRPGAGNGPSVRLEPSRDPGMAEHERPLEAAGSPPPNHGSPPEPADPARPAPDPTRQAAEPPPPAPVAPPAPPPAAMLLGAGAAVGAAAAPPTGYHVYHARPWAGLADLALATVRGRRAWWLGALLVLACLIGALGAAGAFSSVRPSQRTAAARRGRGGTSGQQVTRQAARQRPAAHANRRRAAARRAKAPAKIAAPAPGGAAQLEAEGHALLTDGHYASAIPVLRQALAATGESTGACVQPTTAMCLTYAYALYDLASALRLSGDAQAAVPLLEQRVQIDNQRSVVQSQLALARAQARGGTSTAGTTAVTTTPRGSPTRRRPSRGPANQQRHQPASGGAALPG